MTVEIIVEDGTGIYQANSPVSIEDADAFWAQQGNFDWDASEDKGAALVRGTQYVAQRYADRWKGKRTYGRQQTLDWPRTGVVDRDGNEVADDEMPIEYKNAVYVASLMASLGETDMTTEESRVIRSEKIGAMAITYESAGSWTEAGLRFPDCLDDILNNLVTSRNSAQFFMRT